MKGQLGGLKPELKILGDKMDRKFEKLDSKFEKLDSKFDKTDRKFERTDNKIDRLMYFFLGGLILKGGFDSYIDQRRQHDCTTKENYVVGKEK